ncbi:spastin, putative (Protein of unknown function, DUF599) [Thalictrum thalictroides]|uniref:Uncharacterized protein n=1 Tax=Thalictrum thalictroides TaxID=46969 RepID=A0A7J6VRM8_THATH|nr:spastin, putative (Protein of unknown function, DUF599) [Thalictrum thalictroides]
MEWQKKYLDIFLVPSGLIIMLAYHMFLLYRIINFPQTTAIGYEAHNKRAWVERVMMQADPTDVGNALGVISSNTGAATNQASLSIALGSFIGSLVGSSDNNIFTSNLVYGDTSSEINTVKYVSILAFFLLAYASFSQSARKFTHAACLISTPGTEVHIKYMQQDIVMGCNFMYLGQRAHYFAISLTLWIFGPIPMFASSVIMVVILYFLDVNSCPMHEYRSPNTNTQTIEGKARLVAPDEYPGGTLEMNSQTQHA